MASPCPRAWRHGRPGRRHPRRRADRPRHLPPDGRPLQMGERFAVPALAETLRARSPRAARTPSIAADRRADLRRPRRAAGGLLTPDDFAANRADWVTPISAPYRGHTVYQMPPNTQGFTALQILRILDGLDVAALGDGTVPYVHTLAEAARLAFVDRDRYLTDPDFVEIPLDRLLSAEHAAKLRAQIDPQPQGHARGRPDRRRHLLPLRRGPRRQRRLADPEHLLRLRVRRGGRRHRPAAAESRLVLLARPGPSRIGWSRASARSTP